MSGSESGGSTLTPQESWGEIHTTMDRARSSMYLAGTSAILLLWGGLTALGYLAAYWLQTGGSNLGERGPWAWVLAFGALVGAGIVGSAIIGHRAGSRNVTREVNRAVGIRVFGFWMAVAVAAWLIPAAAGMWNDESGPQIPYVAIGIVALGYILYGMMTRPELAVVGVGIAAAFYIPSFLAGDAALAVSAVATLLVVGGATAWLRRIGIR